MKNFLKPNRKKIILTIVFGLIVLVSIRLDIGTSWLEEGLRPSLILTLLWAIPFIIAYGLPYFNIVWYPEEVFNIVFIVLELIFLYLLSCLIIWFYDKIKFFLERSK